MTSSQILKNGDFLWDKNTLEWKIGSLWPRLVRKQDLAKGGRLEPKVNVFKIGVKLWRRDEQTYVTQTITDGGLGTGSPAVPSQSPEAMSDFLKIL